jgi:hypothetical protein
MNQLESMGSEYIDYVIAVGAELHAALPPQ